MLSKEQIKLVQCAARGAGLRGDRFAPDSRYYLLLSQYKQSRGQRVTSCTQLTLRQMEDFLAICESMGWRHPDKEVDFYRKKLWRYTEQGYCGLSSAQLEAIKHLKGDLGMTDEQLHAFADRMFPGIAFDQLANVQGGKLIEGLKAVLGRRDKKEYKSVAEIAEQYETDQGF
ncbi:MAG: regulatory protein GemA [Planctomycetaceae bacterium]|nr:regulatory protein GemA [Planctomycetaceae bacterium]